MIISVVLLAMLYFCFRSKAEWKYSIISASIIMAVVIVVTAEILSAFQIWNKQYILIFYSFLIIFLIFFKKNKIILGIRESNTKLYVKSEKGFRNGWYILWISMIAFIALLILARGLLYPSQNGDSLTYHCSRSFLYYKNSSIHNMPFSYKWGLYTAPFSAVLMAHMRILLSGSDRICNLVQFPAWIVGGITIYEIGRILKLTKIKSLFAAFLFYTLPLAILQAATTQCDLLAAVMVVITVYYLIRIIEKNVKTDYFLAGFSGGIAMFTKVTNAIPLLVAGVLFIIFYYKKYAGKKIVGNLMVIGMSASVINFGYWLRNAIDLKGDIFAIGMSRSMGESIKQPLLSKLLLNISYLFGSTNKRYCEFIDKFILKIHSIISGGGENFGYTSYCAEISHDVQAFGVYMWLAMLVIPLLVYFIKIRKEAGIILSVGWIVMLISSAVSFPFTPAGVRYMLPPIMFSTVLISYALDKGWDCLSKNGKKVGTIFLISCSVFLFGKGVSTNIYDYYQPLNREWNSKTFDELRDWRYGYQWQPAINEYMTIIKQNGWTNIGFYEEKVIGQYPMLYEFSDSIYTVEYVNAQYGNDYESKDFYPECIIVTENKQKESITYHNKLYKKLDMSFPIQEDNYVSLYVMNEKR